MTGTNLVEVKDCTGKKLGLSFQVVNVTGDQEGATIALEPISQSPGEWTFNLPHRAARKGTTWKVKMLLNGEEVKGVSPVALN